MPRAPIVMAFAFVPLTWYVLYRTPFGLRLRAVGENPRRPMPPGVNVARIRYSGVMLSGALAAHRRRLPLDRPVVALHAQHDVGPRLHRAGGADLRQVAAGADDARVPVFRLRRGDDHPDAGRCKLPSGEDIPVQFIQMVPYVLTIVVLAGFIGHSRPPRALGQPYEKER